MSKLELRLASIGALPLSRPATNGMSSVQGIENDVKIWAPTAFERRVPGMEAEPTMTRNRRAQGNASIVISPFILARLIGMSPPRCGMTCVPGRHFRSVLAAQ